MRSETIKRYQKKRREQAKTAGICTVCYHQPASSGREFCPACQEKRTAYQHRYYKANAEERNAKQRERNHQIKAQIIEHYGGRCTCCGFDQLAALTLDHINGCGARQRERQGNGNVFYLWLTRNHYPEGFQILCANCHLSKTLAGHCILEHSITMPGGSAVPQQW